MENQLRFWKPRSPSARLRARLFPGAEQVMIATSHGVGGRWAWLAPVMGCFLVMMVVSSSRQHQFGYLSASPKTDWLTAVTSNQQYAAYVAASFHTEQNSFHNEPIEWTNGPRIRRAPASITLPATNSLIR